MVNFLGKVLALILAPFYLGFFIAAVVITVVVMLRVANIDVEHDIVAALDRGIAEWKAEGARQESETETAVPGQVRNQAAQPQGTRVECTGIAACQRSMPLEQSFLLAATTGNYFQVRYHLQSDGLYVWLQLNAAGQWTTYYSSEAWSAISRLNGHEIEVVGSTVIFWLMPS